LPFIKKSYFLKKPQKLFLFLMREFGISIDQAQKMIDTRKISQNGVTILDKAAMVEGEIEVLVFVPETKNLKPIFEAPHFAVYDKPSGVMVHPRNRQSGYTLIDEVRHRYGADANITHRIDKETSGLVLVSKSKVAEKKLKGMFEEKSIQKSYLALVRGRVERELFIDAPILKNSDYSKIKLKVVIDERGKSAQTIVRPIKVWRDYTLVEALPLTGRQHQIRIHLFHVKHPIVGDPIYGVPTEAAIAYLDGKMSEEERLSVTGAPRLMLHAQSLRFIYGSTEYYIVSKEEFMKECERLVRI
jgi:23S rRNA pseudouridine1911/1915/1917 synthase